MLSRFRHVLLWGTVLFSVAASSAIIATAANGAEVDTAINVCGYLAVVGVILTALAWSLHLRPGHPPPRPPDRRRPFAVELPPPRPAPAPYVPPSRRVPVTGPMTFPLPLVPAPKPTGGRGTVYGPVAVAEPTKVDIDTTPDQTEMGPVELDAYLAQEGEEWRNENDEGRS